MKIALSEGTRVVVIVYADTVYICIVPQDRDAPVSVLMLGRMPRLEGLQLADQIVDMIAGVAMGFEGVPAADRQRAVRGGSLTIARHGAAYEKPVPAEGPA